jgi:hypothetical protein
MSFLERTTSSNNFAWLMDEHKSLLVSPDEEPPSPGTSKTAPPSASTKVSEFDKGRGLLSQTSFDVGFTPSASPAVPAKLNNKGYTKREMECIAAMCGIQWQWLHSKLGWQDYEPIPNKRLEEAFQRGDSSLRIKTTGVKGSRPCMVFFQDADPVQFDPVSKKTRPVQRVDDRPKNMFTVYWTRLKRKIMGLARSLRAGDRGLKCLRISRNAARRSLVISPSANTMCLITTTQLASVRK